MKKIEAYDSYTLEYMGEFDSIEAFRKVYPGAEIVGSEINGEVETIYC